MFAITPFEHRNRSTVPMFFNDFDQLSDMMGDFFGVRDGRSEMYEEDGKYYASIEAPGLKPDEAEVKIYRDKLVVRQNSKSEEKSDDKSGSRTWYIKKAERSFSQEIVFPSEVDTEAATASFENGVLKVVAPKIGTSGGRVLQLNK